MEFRILGPVEVSRDGRAVPLGGRQQRAVLALLVLHANRVVSSERIVEQLWGDHPPATAPTALHGHISALRKALGPDLIVTRQPGYVLEIERGQVDLDRFERLRTEARAALGRGDPRSAADTLREALALWRGDALADVGLDSFIQAEAARLEDLRLAALEDRIDADVALGGTTELVAELERLVAAHPLRERLWAQLMLCLYRSGRQADALDAYRRARQTLVSELGIEPGRALRDLERRILEQDPALDSEPRTLAGAERRRIRVGLPLLGAAVLAVAVAAFLLLNGSDAPPAVPPDSVAIIDPRQNAVVGAIPLASGSGPIAAGAGGLWVLNEASSTISRIDPRARRLVNTDGLGGAPGNLAAAAGEVWVADGCWIGGGEATLLHIYTMRDRGIDLDTDSVSLGGAVPRGEPRSLPAGNRCGLAASGQTAWVATNTPSGLVRIDFDRAAAKSRVVSALALPHAPVAVAVGAGSVWPADGDEDVVLQIDPDSGKVERRIRVGRDPVAITADDDAVWVVNRGDDSISRIDARTAAVAKPISVGQDPVAVAIGERSVWVANSGDGSVSRVDPRTNEVAQRISVGHRPEGVAVAGGAVWVTVRPQTR